MNQSRRIQLAQKLNLTEKQIKAWFQNRRTKHKKEQMKLVSRGSTGPAPSNLSIQSEDSAAGSVTNALISSSENLNNTEWESALQSVASHSQTNYSDPGYALYANQGCSVNNYPTGDQILEKSRNFTQNYSNMPAEFYYDIGDVADSFDEMYRNDTWGNTLNTCSETLASINFQSPFSSNTFTM